MSRSTSVSPSLADRLQRALRLGGGALEELTGATPVDTRDTLLALLAIYDLHTAPAARVGPAARWQHHPAVAYLKTDLEDAFLAILDSADSQVSVNLDDAPAALRSLAHVDLVPDIYDWIADDASLDELVEFLTLE